MDDQNRPRQVYEFGGYRLDPLRRVLLGRDGALVHLKPKAFATLLHLIEHAGETLDKRSILEAIWPNAVVEENSLNKNVSALRRALGETPGEHRFIVTEPGHGYRFVAEVRTTSVDTETVVATADVTDLRLRPRWSAVDLLLAGLLTTVVALAVRSSHRDACCECGSDSERRRGGAVRG
jgi:DNA-binding winged helix-turn-helix (wHTH) protein